MITHFKYFTDSKHFGFYDDNFLMDIFPETYPDYSICNEYFHVLRQVISRSSSWISHIKFTGTNPSPLAAFDLLGLPSWQWCTLCFH